MLHHHMSLTCCRKSHHTPATLAPAHTPCLFSIVLHTVRQHLVIAHFLLILLMSGTLFQMISDVPHHCRHFNLVCIILVSFSLQRLIFLFDHCTYVHCLAFFFICCRPFFEMHCVTINNNTKIIIIKDKEKKVTLTTS